MKIFSLLLLLLISACGVKNDPIPPGVQAEIGRGRPKAKAWLIEKEDGSVDPASLEVLDYLEDKKEVKKKKK